MFMDDWQEVLFTGTKCQQNKMSVVFHYNHVTLLFIIMEHLYFLIKQLVLVTICYFSVTSATLVLLQVS